MKKHNSHMFPEYAFIATSGSRLTVSHYYQYREGLFIKEVQLLSINEDKDQWLFDLYYRKDQRKSHVSFAKDAKNIGYGGIWQLVDNNTYDVLQAETEYETRQMEAAIELEGAEIEVLDLSGLSANDPKLT